MLRLSRAVGILVAGILALAAGEMRAAGPVAPYFNGVFPETAPGSASGWSTENAFPHLTFVDPLWLTPIPGGDELLVICKNGQIWRLPNDAATTPEQRVLVLDLGPQVQTSQDQGLYRVIFHPEFGAPESLHTNDVFACYNHRPDSPDASPNASMWRVSRFQWDPATGTIDPASEEVLIQQYDPHSWHNGGAMDFDNEGFLLVTCGDGGGAYDQFNLAQKINLGFFSGVLRIDPDNRPEKSHPIRRQPLDPAGKPASFPASFSQGYGIPHDNPWLDPDGGVLEEFYAIGLRSPHSAKFDHETGELWVGDVGQSMEEEITRIFKGANCQWPFLEGTMSGWNLKPRPSPANLIGAETVPFHSYGRSAGTCVIGGFRYRGAKWAGELGGDILFGDNGKGDLSAATPRQGQPPFLRSLVTGFGPGIYSGLSAIATDAAGEIYMLKLNGVGQDGGTIHRLVKTGSQPEPPALLSATGLFTDMETLQPAAPLIPYDVASPLWSDGAEKKRWLILPNDGVHNTAAEKIAFSEDGNWSFPAGTVFVKHFETGIDERNPGEIRRLETRVIVCTATGGKYGLTYKWNAEGTEATLLSGGEEIAYDHTTQSGEVETRHWSIPSRADCMQCHSDVSGQALGLRTHQINRPVTDPDSGVVQNQLERFRSSGYFSSYPGPTAHTGMLKASPPDDESIPLEHRVRSYLDANCAHCHQPGAGAPYFDARLTTPLRGQNLIDGLIEGHFHLGPDGRYIRPGDPLLSAIHARTASVTPGIAMPPLAKHRADEAAVAMLAEYISGLSADEFSGQPTPQARYLRISAVGTAGSRAAIAELTVLDGRGMPIPAQEIAVAGVSSQAAGLPASMVLDGNPMTFWMSGNSPPPHFLTLDLGSVREVGGFIYTPRQDGPTGRITNYEVLLSQDGGDWTVAGSGTWQASAAPIRSDDFNKPRPVRCEIAGPSQPVDSAFEATIVFDSIVTDFTAENIAVDGGVITAFRGKGYYYVATVLAHETTVEISVPEHVVSAGHAGNRASNTWVVQNIGETSPVPRFVRVPEIVSGGFMIDVAFDSPVHVHTLDFKVTGGSIRHWYVRQDDLTLLIDPHGTDDVTVRLEAGATGVNGLPMNESIEVTIPFGSPNMAVEAESGTVAGGFVVVEDPSASGGAYLWVPEGARDGDSSLDPALKTTFHVTVPHTAEYRLIGLTRSDDAASNSFYVGIDGETTPARWLTNQAAGETGSGRFHGNAVNADGSPRIFNLTAGTHVLELFAGDDGTRIDRLEFVGVRPMPIWVESGKRADLPYVATLRFSTEVSGLEIDDFEVIGGAIESISGSGSEYRIQLVYSPGEIAVTLKEGAVQDAEGRPNHASAMILLELVDTYEQWAINHGVDPSEEARGADTDGDGIPQILEYAFGLDPSRADARVFDPENPSARGLPRMIPIFGDGWRSMEIEFLVRRNASLEYFPEFGSDLSTFTEGWMYYDYTEVDWQWIRRRAYDLTATGQESRRFGRVRVEEGQ